MTWAVDVPCEMCGAGPGDECRTPANQLAQRPHRVRLVLSVVGLKSSAAVNTIETILREADTRSTTATYTLPEKRS